MSPQPAGSIGPAAGVRFRTEASALLRLAVPVALSQLAIMGMGTTDVLLAGRAGTSELSGLSLGNNIWHSIILFFFGIGSITQALVGRYHGARDWSSIREQLVQSLWMTFALGLVGVIVLLLVAELILLGPIEPALSGKASQYLYAIVWGALPMTMMPAVRGALEAMNLTRAVLWINLAAFLINIPLDYALIFGLWGLPKLGAVGCAWATAMLLWASLLAYILLLLFHPALRTARLLRQWQAPERKRLASTFWLGLPIGFSIVIEMSMFSGVGILIAMLGTTATAAHAIALSIASTSFMLYMGLGQGITIRASQHLGAGDAAAARYAVGVGMRINLVLALLMSIVFLLSREPLVALFSGDADVAALAVGLMLFAALFQLGDCLQITVLSALRAWHDTASPPRYQMIAFWGIGLPIGTGLGLYNWWPALAGAPGFWLAMVLGLFIAAGLMYRRLQVVMYADLNAD